MAKLVYRDEGKTWQRGVRMSRLFPAWAAIVWIHAVALAAEPSSRPPERKAFFDARSRQTEYVGPGRELEPPDDSSEVAIGYFGPSDPAHCEGGLWSAAAMAVDEANAQGGYRGKPFRLVPAWSENPWGNGAARVARMVYVDRVWAIVGGIDGDSTHLAEQVAAKARLPLVSPATGDKSVNLANVPWMFSCLPGDHLQAPVLAERIAPRVGKEPFVLVAAGDHDSRHFSVELMKHLGGRRVGPSYRFTCRPGADDYADAAAQILDAKPGAVVLIAGPRDSARLVTALRERDFTGAVFGGPWMGRRTFRQEARAAAEGVLFPLLWQPQETHVGFVEAFRARHGQAPDYAAAHTYDAVRLLIAAVRRAGLNRARIRDALAGLSPYSGTTGTIRWDPLGSNTRPVGLGTIRDGRVVAVVSSPGTAPLDNAPAGR
ncbi:MAG: ABC transporter substrate-binding protein [Planctomycetota bacterium]